MGVLRARRNIKRPQRRGSGMIYDIISVGRVAQDTILTGCIFRPYCSHGVCRENIPVGEKVKVDDVQVYYGGNALNTSVTFARQKLSVALLAQVGNDAKSEEVLNLLSKEGVDSSMVLVEDDNKIALSTIIVNTNGERSVLAYTGSAAKVQKLLNSLEQVETRWLYLSSLNSPELLEGVLRYAQINQIKVAFNPGGSELQSVEYLKKLLEGIEVLILNLEEARHLFGQDVSAAELAKIGSKYSKLCVVTDGPNGAQAFDGEIGYYQPISSNVKVVDRNGAGDAFASGLVSSLACGLDIKAALEFGSSNATSVVQQFGPQAGILKA